VTRDQILHEIRKELGINDRLAGLLTQYGKLFADTALRQSYQTNDAAVLIRQAGMAEGAEKFLKDITALPNGAARKDQPE
jgi:hypothetical protein